MMPGSGVGETLLAVPSKKSVIGANTVLRWHGKVYCDSHRQPDHTPFLFTKLTWASAEGHEGLRPVQYKLCQRMLGTASQEERLQRQQGMRNSRRERVAESLSELQSPRVRGLRYSGPESYDILPQKALLQCPRPVQELRDTTVAQCWAVGLHAQAISLQSQHLETQVSGFYTLELYSCQALRCSPWAAVPGLWAGTSNTKDCLLACSDLYPWGGAEGLQSAELL